MYKNLVAEMARAGFTNKALAEKINIGEVAFGKKVNEFVDWKINEMVAVQNVLNSENGTSHSLDYFFKKF